MLSENIDYDVINSGVMVREREKGIIYNPLNFRLSKTLFWPDNLKKYKK